MTRNAAPTSNNAMKCDVRNVPARKGYTVSACGPMSGHAPHTLHEKNRLSLVRPLDPVAAVADPLGLRRAAAIDRARGRGRAARRRRRLFPGASLRPPARLA